MSAEVEDALSDGHVNGASLDDAGTPGAGINGDNLDLGDDDEDLFGDDDDDEPLESEALQSQRRLDDEDLDSGDDEGRQDRVAATIEDNDPDDYQKALRQVSADIARIKYPAEGEELYFLNMPPYLGMKHRNYDSATYEPPTLPHDGVDPASDPNRKFSAYSTATTSMYWRRDPKNQELLQSNARIVRWSDGSMTLQLASRPTEHYRVNTTSVRQKLKSGHGYEPGKDSHMYLAASHATTGIDLQIIRPIDATMKIQPTGEQADESVLRLKESLAAQQSTHDPLARIKVVDEDPERAKQQAEAFEKDKARAMRKREAAEDRLLVRRERALGRSGLGGSRSAGLSIAGLEDDDGMPSTRTKKRRKMNMNRRGDIYSDDEDPDAPRRRTREDEYDHDDGFLAHSDEEPETFEDGDEEEVLAESDDPDQDDLEIEGRQTVIEDRTRGGASKSSKASKRSRMNEIEEEDDDAEAEEDTEYLRRQSAAGEGSPGGVAAGGRRRRVVSDEEDEE